MNSRTSLSKSLSIYSFDRDNSKSKYLFESYIHYYCIIFAIVNLDFISSIFTIKLAKTLYDLSPHETAITCNFVLIMFSCTYKMQQKARRRVRRANEAFSTKAYNLQVN